MTDALREALRRVARVQISIAPGIASTQGQDVADEFRVAYESLLTALDQQEDKPGVFGERLFSPKKRAKKT